LNPAPLLIEIGCEEIPARMIQPAAGELATRLGEILTAAQLAHGEVTAWGGSRRLTVRIERVDATGADREETVLGPAAKVAFDAEGRPTAAACGFARKQGIEPSELMRIETERGDYVGHRRRVRGRDVGELLAAALPGAVETMSFPKVMRWGDGRLRWVRPVHWLLALHGERVLPLELLGARAARNTEGHRFLGERGIEVRHPDDYAATLERAHVVADPAERRARLARRLAEEARNLGGEPVEDPELLEEIADLVEWPGVVAGSFEPGYLELPRELLVTTLRHHQKCFSVRDREGKLLPHFLAVANTDRDRRGHIRRGNEWVIGGRLEDARFFWREDRRRTLESRSSELARVVLHAELGSYADKVRRVVGIARRLAARIELDGETLGHVEAAAWLAKNDLVTGSVGEFPELQGKVGGLLLEAEGHPVAVARAVYEHHRPAGPTDALPSTAVGAVVAAADKLDTVAEFVRIGEAPTGSRDPFGLRRAANGLLRIAIERGWATGLEDLAELAGGGQELQRFLEERFVAFLRESGFTSREIRAVVRPRAAAGEARPTGLADVVARVAAIRELRGRSDFVELVKLTERVDTILTRNEAELANWFRDIAPAPVPQGEAAEALERAVARLDPQIDDAAAHGAYGTVIDRLAELVDPVERFFEAVLVIDRDDPAGTRRRWELLTRLRGILTRHCDIRELAGQADRRE
jgi:glycyl-tRNA synthetase beta chain